MSVDMIPTADLQAVDKSVARKLVAVDLERVRAEERRRDADAAADRRLTERAELVRLAQQREEAKENRKERRAAAKEARRKERRETRAARWTARLAKARSVAPTLARRAVLTGPIAFPMAVAWIGQIGFATKVLHWWLPGGIAFAASWELSTVYVARLAYQARQDGDSAWGLRAGTAFLAAAAATMNYWHAAQDWTPNPVAVSYGFMSLLGIALWEAYSEVKARKARRAAGTLAEPRPQLGMMFWLRYRRLAWAAYSACIADPSIKTRTAAIAAGQRARQKAEQDDRRAELARLARKAVKKANRGKGDAGAALAHLVRLADLYGQPAPAVPALTAAAEITARAAHRDTAQPTVAHDVDAQQVAAQHPAVSGSVSGTVEWSAVSDPAHPATVSAPAERSRPPAPRTAQARALPAARTERSIVQATVTAPADGELSADEKRMYAAWKKAVAEGRRPTASELVKVGGVSEATAKRRRETWEKQAAEATAGGAR